MIEAQPRAMRSCEGWGADRTTCCPTRNPCNGFIGLYHRKTAYDSGVPPRS